MKNEKKMRNPNFTPDEKLILVRIIADKYALIIEDKKTDRNSVSAKEKAWADIELDFNSTSSASIYRSARMLKKCYENRKKEVRKSLAEERKVALLTGVRPPAKTKKIHEEDEVVRSILEKTMVGLPESCNDDVEDMQPSSSHRNIVDYTSKHEMESDGPTSSSETWKKCKPAELKTLESITLYSDDETNLGTLTDNKGKSTAKMLRKSNVVKKYGLLLNKRLVLIEKQIEKMDEELDYERKANILNLRKKKLEILLLEKQLNL